MFECRRLSYRLDRHPKKPSLMYPLLHVASTIASIFLATSLSHSLSLNRWVNLRACGRTMYPIDMFPLYRNHLNRTVTPLMMPFHFLLLHIQAFVEPENNLFDDSYDRNNQACFEQSSKLIIKRLSLSLSRVVYCHVFALRYCNNCTIIYCVCCSCNRLS